MAKKQTQVERFGGVVRISVPNMLGGVSRLPAALRLPSQFEDAENVTLHYARGLEKRPGTEYIKPGASYVTADINSGLDVADSTSSSTTNFFHWVDRDSDEKYLMVFSGNSTTPLEIFNVTDSSVATKCTVTYDTPTTAALKTYLSTLDSGVLKLKAISFEDTTIVVNQSVTTAVSASLPSGTTNGGYQYESTNVELYSNKHHRLGVFAPNPENGATLAPETGFPQPPTAATTELDTYWYARTSEGGFPSGWYKARSSTSDPWPWYSRVATPFVGSEFDAATMPLQIRNTAPNVFAVSHVPWKPRLSGNPALNAAPSFVGKKINDMAIHRGRLWIAAGEQLCASRTNDLFNFWIDDYQLLRDDDRIDITIGSGKVNIISHMVTFAKALILFTDSNQQFEVRGEPIISPTNVALLPTTNYGAVSCRPVTTNRQLYATVTKGTATQVHEYMYNEQAANNISMDVAALVEGWLPPNIEQAVTSNTGDVVFFRSKFPGHTENVYILHMFWNGNERVQMSWCKWSFQNDSKIQSIQVFDDWLYICFKRSIAAAPANVKANQLWVERVRIRNLDNVYINDPTTELLFEPRLDRQFEVLISSDPEWTDYWSYDSEEIKTSLYIPFYDQVYDIISPSNCYVMMTLDQVKGKGNTIAGTLYIVNPADVTTFTDANSRVWTKITIPGAFELGTRFVIGRSYGADITMSRVHVRDETNNTPIVGTVQIKQLSVSHDDTGYIAVKITPENRPTLTWEYTGRYVGGYDLNDESLSDEVTSHFKVMASADHTVIEVTNPEPTPLRISNMEYLVNFIPYKRSGAF